MNPAIGPQPAHIVTSSDFPGNRERFQDGVRSGCNLLGRTLVFSCFANRTGNCLLSLDPLAPSVTHLIRESEPSVFHFVVGIEHVERSLVMGDDDDSGLLFVGDLGEKFHDLPSSMAVESSGWFIRENNAGPIS